MHVITEESISKYELYLRENEKTAATVEKYVSVLRKLMQYLDGEDITKQRLISYRDKLCSDHTAQSVNGTICAVNAYLKMIGLPECRLKLLKVQKRVFRDEKRQMSREEYQRLLRTAEKQGKTRLRLIMETICSTGIRVSEIEYITVEALKAGKAEVYMKGKIRVILIPRQLSSKLLKYAADKNIVSGSIFLTNRGNVISRKQIWAEMKALCEKAGVELSKVFPHNLRHLFARCYYGETHDVVRLADMLGHSSIDTTRIYLLSTDKEHAKALENLRLVS